MRARVVWVVAGACLWHSKSVGSHPLLRVVWYKFFLERLTALKPYENESNNRSVMPSDALGRTRATMLDTAGLACSERSG